MLLKFYSTYNNNVQAITFLHLISKLNGRLKSRQKRDLSTTSGKPISVLLANNIRKISSFWKLGYFKCSINVGVVTIAILQWNRYLDTKLQLGNICLPEQLFLTRCVSYFEHLARKFLWHSGYFHLDRELYWCPKRRLTNTHWHVWHDF